MLPPPEYTRDVMAEQLRRWNDAVDAYRRRDRPELARLIADPDRLTPADAFPYVTTFTLLGAYMCASAMATTNGHHLGSPPPGARYIVEQADPTVELDGTARICAAAITDASNGDFDAVRQRLRAYIKPTTDGITRLYQVMLHLLGTYAALTADGAA
jgi:hypothetical protein